MIAPLFTIEFQLKLELNTPLGVSNMLAFDSEVLVKWECILDFNSTWEDLDNIHGTFPEFDLEDKVGVG